MPRLLDLFSCAGGAAEGYRRAGWYVVGVDIRPQPRYAGDEFVQADAMTYPLAGFDAIHASPPCQAHTQMSAKHRGHGTLADERVDLIAATRFRLECSGRPWVIENVVGARPAMPAAKMLCGRSLGQPLHRHRLFESSVALEFPPHVAGRDAFGVYGKLDGRLLWQRTDGTQLRAPKTLTEAQTAMGIDWMEWDELKESIPPSYTEHVGKQLMEAIS